MVDKYTDNRVRFTNMAERSEGEAFMGSDQSTGESGGPVYRCGNGSWTEQFGAADCVDSSQWAYAVSLTTQSRSFTQVEPSGEQPSIKEYPLDTDVVNAGPLIGYWRSDIVAMARQQLGEISPIDSPWDDSL
ncbi:MAG: hypothetical protein KC621_00965 [Myxococcales bacterium]|nr:hypothetical protein [Myxococcales bacterium]